MINTIPSIGQQVFDNTLSLLLVVSQGSVLTISGFAYPNETLTAPTGSSYQWYVDDIARGTAQTLTFTVNDIGLSVRCVVGAAECTPVTVWHPRDIANVKNFWWAGRGAYNSVANNVTDANASITASQPTLTTINRVTGGDLNGKAAYGNNIGVYDTFSSWCYWNGSQWILNVAPIDVGDNPTDYTYYSSDSTAYPWEVTTWTGSPGPQTVTRQVTTYDVLAADGQTVAGWRDIISGLNVTASSFNIALFEETDLATTSLKFDSTDYFTIPVALRTVFNSQNYGYIFAGVKDTAPTAGDATHGVVSINRTSARAKIALSTRLNLNNIFVASTGPNTTLITNASVGPSNSNYNVLTNEAKWVDGEINLRINGDLADSQIFTPAIPNSTTVPSYIGADGSADTSNFNGYMTAIVLATDLMSDTDRNRIERFIGLLDGLDILLV